MPRPKLVIDGRFTVPVVIDTREQLAFDFLGLNCDQADGGGPLAIPTVRGTLASGDYSLVGYETRVAVERKSAADLFGTLGQGRDRFERELERLAEYDYAAVVVEADWREILGIKPSSLVALRHVFAGMVEKGLTDHPWEAWVALLDSAMPGPPKRSQLNPKTCFRSVIAWQQRYPMIHWWLCFDRRFAEVSTFRILERYLRDAHESSKRLDSAS